MEAAISKLASFPSQGIIINTVSSSTAVQVFQSYRTLLSSATARVEFAPFEKALLEISVSYNANSSKGGFTLLTTAARRLEPLSSSQEQLMIVALQRLIDLTIAAGVPLPTPSDRVSMDLPSTSPATSTVASGTTSTSSNSINRNSTSNSHFEGSSQDRMDQKAYSASKSTKYKRKAETEETSHSNRRKKPRVSDELGRSSPKFEEDLVNEMQGSRPDGTSSIRAEKSKSKDGQKKIRSSINSTTTQASSRSTKRVPSRTRSPSANGPIPSSSNQLTRPAKTWPDLMREAIQSTPEQYMTSNAIAEFIIEKYAFFNSSLETKKLTSSNVRSCLGKPRGFKKLNLAPSTAWNGKAGYYWGLAEDGEESEGRSSGTSDDGDESDDSDDRMASDKPSSSREKNRPIESSKNQHTRPSKTWPELIREAIQSTPEQRMTVRSIVEFIQGNYPFFRLSSEKEKLTFSNVQSSLYKSGGFKKGALVSPVYKKNEGYYWGLADGEEVEGRASGTSDDGDESDDSDDGMVVDKPSSSKQDPKPIQSRKNKYTRPAKTWADLLREAIQSTPEHYITTRAALDFITSKYPFFSQQETSALRNIGWCLGQSGHFKKLEQGTGIAYYWGLADGEEAEGRSSGTSDEAEESDAMEDGMVVDKPSSLRAKHRPIQSKKKLSKSPETEDSESELDEEGTSSKSSGDSKLPRTSTMIMEAIESTENKRATTQEIIEMIYVNYPSTRRDPHSWLVKVQSRLTQSPKFGLVPVEGKSIYSRGNYWKIIQPSAPPKLRTYTAPKPRTSIKTSIKSKPDTLPNLIAVAILSNPKKKMTVEEISKYLRKNYERYGERDFEKLKKSVSVTVSANSDGFKKGELSSNNKAYYWSIRSNEEDIGSNVESDEDEMEAGNESAVESEVESEANFTEIESQGEISDEEMDKNGKYRMDASEEEAGSAIPTPTNNRNNSSTPPRPILPPRLRNASPSTSTAAPSRSRAVPSSSASQERRPPSNPFSLDTPAIETVSSRVDPVASTSSASQRRSNIDRMEGVSEELERSKEEKEKDKRVEAARVKPVKKEKVFMSFDF